MDYVLLESIMRDNPHHVIQAIPVDFFRPAYKVGSPNIGSPNIGDLFDIKYSGTEPNRLIVRGNLVDIFQKDFTHEFLRGDRLSLISLSKPFEDLNWANDIKNLSKKYSLDTESSDFNSAFKSLSDQKLLEGDLYAVSANHKRKTLTTIVFIYKHDTLEIKDDNKLMYNGVDITKSFDPDSVSHALGKNYVGAVRYAGSGAFTLQTLAPGIDYGVYGAPYRSNRTIVPIQDKVIESISFIK
jgi:hypothetical protein